jgi:hypothetical protein
VDVVGIRRGEHAGGGKVKDVADHLAHPLVPYADPQAACQQVRAAETGGRRGRRTEERGALVVVGRELHRQRIVGDDGHRPAHGVVQEVEEGEVPDVG